MSATPARNARHAADRDAALAAADRACARIAPSWPLDRAIAVNPLWGFIDHPLPRAAAYVAALNGSRLLMPRHWYRELWQQGVLHTGHLDEAIRQTGAACSRDQLIALLAADTVGPPRRPRVTDVVDAQRDVVHHMAWCDFVTHALSQFCAAYFDDGQARLQPERAAGLYRSWRQQAAHDHSPGLLMGRRDICRLARELPDDATTLISQALDALQVPAAEREAYCTSLLLSLQGWAAWCAYLRWQARLAGGDDDHILELLAMRLAWELLLTGSDGEAGAGPHWRAAMEQWPTADARAAATQALDWVLQRAVEIAYQQPLATGLAAGLRPTATPASSPAVQAVFCIDVRSEVFRRALEAAAPAVQTLGFAGFFGLPIDYQPLAAPGARPQLPGLLAPSLRVTDQGGSPALADRRRLRLQLNGSWKSFKSAAISGFSFVESMGLLYAGKLLSDSLGVTRPVAHHEGAGLRAGERARLRPRLAGPDGGPLPLAERVALAGGILRGMSLTGDFAPLVLLAGHGSSTTNNPQGASLDCGACCGQTGEVNARALAALLNDPQVRRGLAEMAIVVPATTWFVAGLHNTTTDTMELFDLDPPSAEHAAGLAQLRGWLEAAGVQARAERAAALGLGGLDGPALDRAVHRRAQDWSQLRPEWGLANNAAFIVAPRGRSQHLRLDGRAFLHDYRWQEDPDFAVLELIMTAPMVVTHWINLQYYASTVDNQRYGSGNKVLHNVVGGHLGVFEGNGGDLRIGLSLQSVHDGRRWVHTPLRLSVFIEAPRDAIAAVLARHEQVHQLVTGEWLYLFQLDAETGRVWQYRDGHWAPAAEAVG